MLTGSASLLQQPGPLRNASHAVPMQPLDDRFSQLARTFELASGETTVRLWCTISLLLSSQHGLRAPHLEEGCPLRNAVYFTTLYPGARQVAAMRFSLAWARP